MNQKLVFQLLSLSDTVTTYVKYDKFFTKWYVNSNQGSNKTGIISFLPSTVFQCVAEEKSVCLFQLSDLLVSFWGQILCEIW